MNRTDAELKAYVMEHFFMGASSAEIDQILALYPSDPTAGSPFDTGDANAITPEFKRQSAFIGDVIFQAPRRFFLQQRSHKQPTFAFCSSASFT
jgi:acetylcholinesterase